jgi:DNA-binding Lrp family transcriptional regulator
VLKQHANENIRELGKRCGFSPQKVVRIIKKLEKEDRIWGYTAVEDGEENELKHFVLLVKRSTVPLDDDRKREVTMEKLDNYVPGELNR